MRARISRPVLGNLAGIACMLFWATNFPLVAKLLETWHPLLIAPARMAIAAATIALFAVCLGQGRHIAAIPARDLFRIGGLALSASIVCIIWAQVYADPVTAAVVISAMPLTSALMGLAAGTEKVNWRIGAGLVLAIVGGVTTSLASQADDGAYDGASSLIGAGLMIVGSVLYVWHSRALVIRYAHVPDAAKSAAIMATSALSTGLAAVVATGIGWVPARFDLSGDNMLYLGVLGVFTVGASTVLWFVTGRLVGVTIAAMHHNMVPFYVILMSAWTGTAAHVQHFIGAGLVIAGAAIAQHRAPDPRARTDVN